MKKNISFYSAMILKENYTLKNGIAIPKMGLGTWFISNKNVEKAVQQAIKIGYRHIDTAQAYRNEEGVGKGIKAAGVYREDIFVTTKLAAGAKSFKKAAKAIDKSLAKLGLDYIDLMIIHSPQPWTKFGSSNRYFEENREVWKALEEAYHQGKVKVIGLSNFDIQDIENILEICNVHPAVNQVLAHIGNTPTELIKYCQNKNILVEAYSPIAHGELLKHDEVVQMAEKYRVSVPQLSIKYDLQLGLLPLPKTANPKHMQTNAQLDFEISETDMQILKNVSEIKDYGDAAIMPVFGGKMNLKSIFKMIVETIKG